jgi:hypothetical protein
MDSCGVVSFSGSLVSSWLDDPSDSYGSVTIPAWLGYGGSRVDLPPLMITAFTFSDTGTVAATWQVEFRSFY